jgi:hypothetical protein
MKQLVTESFASGLMSRNNTSNDNNTNGELIAMLQETLRQLRLVDNHDLVLLRMKIQDTIDRARGE